MAKTRTKSDARQRIVETAERLFYADDDYLRMKGAIRADVKQIKLETKKRQEQMKLKETEKQKHHNGMYMDGTSRNVKTSSYLPSYVQDHRGEDDQHDHRGRAHRALERGHQHLG